MTLQKRLASPWIILLCILLGGVIGAYVPVIGDIGFTIGALYLAIVSMAALPLQVVAGIFGLRQICALPRPMLRLAAMATLSVALMLGAALVATLIGAVARPGASLTSADQLHLGRIVSEARQDSININLQDDGNADSNGNAGTGSNDNGDDIADSTTSTNISNAVGGTETGSRAARLAMTPHRPALTEIVPDNFYKTLADGHLLGILTGTLLFGFAFARVSKNQNQSLNQILEGAYRTFEIVIDRANLFIPVLAFGMTAHLVGRLDMPTLTALSGLIMTFLVLIAALSSLAIWAISRAGHHRLDTVLDALNTPMLISLTSGNASASIPSTIDAMSAQLGFSRAVAELLVPFGTVFLRVGNAVYYACVALFIAALYHHPLTSTTLMLIWLGAALAAFLSSGFSGVASIGYVTFTISFLQLPAEAAIVLLLTIDPLCNGPRNLLSMLTVCALTAMASAGLPSERAVVEQAAGGQRVVTLVFTRAQFLLSLGCGGLIGAFALLIGIGVGAR